MSEKKKRCRVQGGWASATSQRLMWEENKGSNEFRFQPNKAVCEFFYLYQFVLHSRLLEKSTFLSSKLITYIICQDILLLIHALPNDLCMLFCMSAAFPILASSKIVSMKVNFFLFCLFHQIGPKEPVY